MKKTGTHGKVKAAQVLRRKINIRYQADESNMKRTVSEVFLGEGPRTKGLMGNGSARLWNPCPGNMKASTSETRGYMPILKVYFEKPLNRQILKMRL